MAVIVFVAVLARASLLITSYQFPQVRMTRATCSRFVVVAIVARVARRQTIGSMEDGISEIKVTNPIRRANVRIE